MPGQSTTGDTVFTVHGTVVNGKTGAPVARALVTSADRRLATMTDEEGRFVLRVSVPAVETLQGAVSGAGAAMPRGALVLSAQKPGWLFTKAFQVAPINDLLNTTAQELTLMPAAIVTGRVSVAGSETAEGVRVQLLMRQAREGSLAWQRISVQQTDVEGRFRFGDLHSGEYTLVTAAWAGEQPLPRDVAATTEQYPADFLGDNRDLASATRLHLHFGDEVRTELHLQQTRFYPVVIPVDAGAGRVAVNARLSGQGASESYPLRYNQRDGAVEGELPDGTYQVLLSGGGLTQGSAEVAVHVAGAPVRTAAVTFSPARSIAVHVRFELGASQRTHLPGFQLSLQSTDFGTGGVGGSTHPDEQGDAQTDFTLEEVQAGSYDVITRAFSGYVAAMSCGGVDLLQHPLVVGTSGVRDPIQVTVRDDVGRLSGKVTAEGALPAAAVVILLPLGGASRFSFTFAAGDGSFEIDGVPPGSYRILAGTGMPWQIAYKDEATVRALEEKGSVITMDPGGKQTANPPWIGSFDDLVP